VTAEALASTQPSGATTAARARFRFDPASRSRRCRFIDVWDDGAAIELYDVDGGESLRRPIHLETGVKRNERSVIELHGMLTRSIRTEAGRIIVLVRFWALAHQQRLLVRGLVNLPLPIRSGQ
jgi:hypothetical protein